MICQIHLLSEAGTELSSKELLFLRIRKKLTYLEQGMKKITSNPFIIIKKVKSLLAFNKTSFSRGYEPINRSWIKSSILGLMPGEKVRVKALSEIELTLDEKGRYDGLAFMKIAMSKYCDGIYTVKKRIHLFYDERRRKLLKLRNVVILEDVYCELPKDFPQEYAGCDRTCFLFWKEAWLERVSDEKKGKD